MAKASRSKRKRAAVRSAKRSRNNSWWYALTALVVIAGISLIVYARATAPSPEGPYVADNVNVKNPHNADTHWHAALGVYDCDKWLGDGSGEGVWNWPNATPTGSPARAGNTNIYAGLHSHDDGIIHMEPQVNEDAGRRATVGRYFDYGGWDLSSTGFDFLGTKRQNGDKCPNGQPGTLQWATAKWDGSSPPKPQKYTVRTGDPSSFKLDDGDVVKIAFLPPGKTLESIGNPPSLKNLPGAENRETAPNEVPSVTTVPAAPPTTAAAQKAPTAPTSTP